jgi:hypothetical protein
MCLFLTLLFFGPDDGVEFSFETSFASKRTTQHYIPEDITFRLFLIIAGQVRKSLPGTFIWEILIFRITAFLDFAHRPNYKY